MSKHYFEYVGGSSAKFWETSVSGNEVTVRFRADRHTRGSRRRRPSLMLRRPQGMRRS